MFAMKLKNIVNFSSFISSYIYCYDYLWVLYYEVTSNFMYNLKP